MAFFLAVRSVLLTNNPPLLLMNPYELTLFYDTLSIAALPSLGRRCLPFFEGEDRGSWIGVFSQEDSPFPPSRNIGSFSLPRPRPMNSEGMFSCSFFSSLSESTPCQSLYPRAAAEAFFPPPRQGGRLPAPLTNGPYSFFGRRRFSPSPSPPPDCRALSSGRAVREVD